MERCVNVSNNPALAALAPFGLGPHPFPYQHQGFQCPTIANASGAGPNTVLPAKINPIALPAVNELRLMAGNALLLARREPERGVYRPLIWLRVWG